MVDIESIDLEFMEYLEYVARTTLSKAENEVKKAKECKALLELPNRKENWDAQENAENDMMEHQQKALSYLKEIAILTRGLEIFKQGLIYNNLRKKVDVK